MQEIMKLTALQLGAAIRRGEVSPTEAVKAALERIEETAGDNAFTEITAERALERAAWAEKELAAGRLAGPLAGVPMALKDNICTRGVSTTCASRILAGFRPPYDATLVERLERAGAVSLGKLNMDEFAMGSTSETSFLGPVRNPWDRGAGSRRLLRRCRGGGGRPLQLVRHRVGHRRLHPPASRILRRHRDQAHLRHRVPVRADRLRLLPGPDRSRWPGTQPTAPPCWTWCMGRDPTGRHLSGCRLPGGCWPP